MRSIGGFLVIVGFGSLILPMFDMQFTILTPIEPFQPIAGIVLGIVGLGLLIMPAMMQRRGAMSSSEPDANAS